ncbi:hypothetical protein ACCE15_05360 [Pseudomonas parafulva]|uniref:hypothetical protein n=1 Tax=Pseudomonas parafulva TaxID=157782 RepID=UPI00356AF59A
MKTKWIKATPTGLIDEVMQLLSIGPSGKVGYQFAAEFFIDSLFGLIEHDHQLDNNSAHKIFRQSILNVFAESKTKDYNRILTEFDKLCHTKLKPERFILITTLQLKNLYLFPQFSIHQCKIKITNSLPKKYLHARIQAISASAHPIESEQNHAYAVVTTEAKSSESAVMKANDSLAILSGLMQVGFKKNLNIFGSNDEEKYPSRLVIDLGKLQSLHVPSGKCHADAIWINTNYEPRNPVSLKNYKNTISHTQKKISQIKRLPFSDHIEKCLLNYSNALSSKSTELRFLKLWVAIEQLLATDDTEMLIRRLSFFYREKTAHQSIIRSLRLARNHHVHGGRCPVNIELKLFQICRFLEHTLLFFISNPFRYKTQTDIISFISLRTESDDIQMEINKLKSALKFIS